MSMLGLTKIQMLTLSAKGSSYKAEGSRAEIEEALKGGRVELAALLYLARQAHSEEVAEEAAKMAVEHKQCTQIMLEEMIRSGLTSNVKSIAEARLNSQVAAGKMSRGATVLTAIGGATSGLRQTAAANLATSSRTTSMNMMEAVGLAEDEDIAMDLMEALIARFGAEPDKIASATIHTPFGEVDSRWRPTLLRHRLRPIPARYILQR